MFPVWTLSSLILSYTLAFPILNNSSTGSYMETFPNVTESMEHNKTRLMENEETFLTVTMWNFPEFNNNQTSGPKCSAPTCAVHNLADRMQSGDEEAGTITGDPWGPGKK
ncbi:hypothetical protein DPX16_13058 [Anabarilius grahami]|uniref:Uncharacterized protein n=1 Tax=Anabarilius grahami TaxID=495550 RepID=A0A3N0XDQ4_ANAGA|nr:hypothetical protein DPX16_13058 [Anabarilius grahami]